jgi:DNA-binding NarL/FixJ family response regulator
MTRAVARTIRIVIADDHRLVRSGLRLLLGEEPEMEVVGETGDAAGALLLAAQLEPDVLVLDLNMPGRSGLDAIPDIAAMSAVTRVVVLTMQSDPGFASRALASGASAFVLKESADGELKRAIRTAALGGQFLSPRMDASPAGRGAAAGTLTVREREVLRLIALGHTNGEIGTLLGLSVRTIESHRAHIAQKVGFSRRAELVRAARELQLLA